MEVNTLQHRIAHLLDLAAPNDAPVEVLLRAALQVNLAVEAAEHLRAAGHQVHLREYGGHAVVCLPLPGGRELAVDPMGRCHWTTLKECQGGDEYVDPDVWDVVAYDQDGEMLEFW